MFGFGKNTSKLDEELDKKAEDKNLSVNDFRLIHDTLNPPDPLRALKVWALVSCTTIAVLLGGFMVVDPKGQYSDDIQKIGLGMIGSGLSGLAGFSIK
jgi:hypothetical protein